MTGYGWFITADIYFSNRYIFGFCLRHVTWNVNQNRTRTAGTCNIERLCNNARQIFYILYQIIVFCNRRGNPCNIDFLERIGTNHRTGNLPCDSDQRNGVHISGCNPGYQVGCTRTGSCQTYANFAGCTSITAGCMSTTLFITD